MCGSDWCSCGTLVILPQYGTRIQRDADLTDLSSITGRGSRGTPLRFYGTRISRISLSIYGARISLSVYGARISRTSLPFTGRRSHGSFFNVCGARNPTESCEERGKSAGIRSRQRKDIRMDPRPVIRERRARSAFRRIVRDPRDPRPVKPEETRAIRVP